MAKKHYELKEIIRGKHDTNKRVELKGYQISKIMDNIEKKEQSEKFWQILPFALLVAFVIFTIIYLAGGGGW